MKLNKKQKNRSALTPAEVGVLTYLLVNRRSDGLFQQHYNEMANSLNSAPSSIHRHIERLKTQHAIVTVQEGQRTRDGYPIPPILKPTPPVEWADSIYGIGEAQSGKNEQSLHKMERDQAQETKGRTPIPNHTEPVPNGTNNNITVVSNPLSTVSVIAEECSAVSHKTLEDEMERARPSQHPDPRIVLKGGKRFLKRSAR
jgi:hypothetical protein